MNIVWKRPDGGVSVTHLMPALIEDGITPAVHAAELQTRAQTEWDAALALDPVAPRPEILDWVVVAEDIEMPATREWRGAWTWTTDDPVIDICPTKAVEVTKERLRRERAPLLAELDVAYIRALEAGNPAAVVAEKQRLRDITALADQVPAGDLAALSALSCV